MKEKLDAFLAEFKQEAVLDAIQIKLSSNPALDITQSKVGGLPRGEPCSLRDPDRVRRRRVAGLRQEQGDRLSAARLLRGGDGAMRPDVLGLARAG